MWIVIIILVLACWSPWLWTNKVVVVVQAKDSCYEVTDSYWMPFGRVANVKYNCNLSQVATVDQNGKTHLPGENIPSKIFVTSLGFSFDLK